MARPLSIPITSSHKESKHWPSPFTANALAEVKFRRRLCTCSAACSGSAHNCWHLRRKITSSMRHARLFFHVAPLLGNANAMLRGKKVDPLRTKQSDTAEVPMKDGAGTSIEPSTINQSDTAEVPMKDGAGTSIEPSTIMPYLDPSSSLLYGAPIYLSASNVFDRSARIVGGSPAGSSEAPFFALLFTWNASDDTWTNMGCGGTLISDRHILTAAHCYQGRTGKKDAVFVNAYDPYDASSSVSYHFSEVKNFFIHPSFLDSANDNDVAIITIQDPIQDKKSFPPVRLMRANHDIKEGQITKVYGFGQLSEANNTPVNTLQVAKIPYISNTQCLQYYPSSLLPDMICAGNPDLPNGQVRQDACAGDSGGPITITGADGFVYQIGIVSWGAGCGRARKPGVYTSVQFHFDWIQSTVCSTKNVDVSIDLCIGYTPVSGRSSSTCTKQQLGDQCSYGGQCCSGNCGSTRYFSERVCQSPRRVLKEPS